MSVLPIGEVLPEMKTSVWVTIIVSAAFTLCFFVTGLVVLAITGHSTDPLTQFFSAANFGGLIYAIARIRAVEKNTNGAISKKDDALISMAQAQSQANNSNGGS